MKPVNWIVAVCLSLFVIAGVAVDASAQQPPAPDTKTAPESVPAQATPQDKAIGQDKPGSEDKSAPGARTDQPQTQPGPSVIDRRVETRTERVEREPARFLGMDPVIALIIGAVVLVVIVLGLVAMSRREDEPHHHRV